MQQILEDGNGTIWLCCGKTVGGFDPAQRTFTPVPFEENIESSSNDLFWLKCDGDGRIFAVRTTVNLPGSARCSLLPPGN